MKKIYLTGVFFSFALILLLSSKKSFSQDCSTLTATYEVTESRCASTGTIQVNASGGSGNYQYKADGPITINYTTSSLLTGIPAGRYLVTVRDIITNCVYDRDSVTVDGSYLTPNFTMVSTGVTCINGNDGQINLTSQTNGRGPFTYRIIAPSASNVGLINATGNFTNLISGNYMIQLRDSCGAIQTRSIIVDNYDWWINSNTVTRLGCDSVSVIINLRDSKGNNSPHSIFNGYTYGASTTTGDTTWFTTNTFNYYKAKQRTIKFYVKDACGNIKSFTWTDTRIPNVGASVSITNRACSTFTATVTGQTNLTAPNYCLFNSSNVQVACNGSGVFNNVAYGSYCIRITDVCYDTTISRCFTVNKPVPSVANTVSFSRYCNNFVATITGQTNLSNPNYCLYDASNNLISCNSTGSFTGIAYGTYCIRVSNNAACYDTTISRCFTVNRSVPSINSIVSISNLECSRFTATITDTANWNSPDFCIYTPARVLVTCNKTGVFNNLPYGSYCIDVTNGPGCYDTTITRCFTVNPPRPSVSNTVTISANTCTDFTATVTGQTNINNPDYCLYNSANVLVRCNNNGVFNNLPYGSYCIRIQNDPACYDTLITRCFTVAPTPLNISLSASASCTNLGTSNLRVDFSSGNPGYSVSLYSPTGTLIQTLTTAGTFLRFQYQPNLATGLKYRIIATDNCNNKDTDYIAPVVYRINRVATFSAKCPTAIWPNGASDVVIDITDNNIGGSIVPKIIKKNNVAVSINATSNSGYRYTFLELGPGTYIFETWINNCSKNVNDTIIVRPYIFPDLFGSKAFQCDNNGFNVSVNTVGGKAPYMYEIFGSAPALPSIITAPQASPIFAINNGSTYSLIRLRVVDGCGNASLQDASVMPLANFIVFSDTLECFGHSLTLRVDSMANAQYNWYKRTLPNDSVLLGNAATLKFNSLLPTDTGRYFCKVVVNNGCIVKYANYVLTGFCGGILPNEVTLDGAKLNEGNKLFWDAGTINVKEYSLQRSQDNNVDFKTINTVISKGEKSYSFLDINPGSGNNYYRLKITTIDNKVTYSNIVMVKNSKFGISFYPNPVNTMLYISISNNSAPRSYSVDLNNILGKKIISKTYTNVQNAIIQFPRTSNISSGLYTITITDLKSNERQTHKLMFK